MAGERKEQIVTLNSTIWTLEALANWLAIRPGALQEKLAQGGIQTLHFGSRYRHRLIRLEDLFKGSGKQDDQG